MANRGKPEHLILLTPFLIFELKIYLVMSVLVSDILFAVVVSVYSGRLIMWTFKVQDIWQTPQTQCCSLGSIILISAETVHLHISINTQSTCAMWDIKQTQPLCWSSRQTVNREWVWIQWKDITFQSEIVTWLIKEYNTVMSGS